MEFLYWLLPKLHFNRQLYNGAYLIFMKITNIVIGNYYKLFYKFIKKSGVKGEIEDREVIVSLTTFGERVEEVSLCIETIMNQKEKPNRIILWLSYTEFSCINNLPKHLKYLQKRGLEIKFCDELRSHKKYYYTMSENPDAVVITLDDDVFYSKYTIKKLMDTYRENSDCICCNNAKYIKYENGKFKPYMTWERVISKDSVKRMDIIPIGVSGVLYPSAKCLSEHVFNKNDIKNLCYHTDDLWLKTMSWLKGTYVVYTGGFSELFCVGKTQRSSLGAINCMGNRNDEQLRNIMNKYHKALLENHDIMQH